MKSTIRMRFGVSFLTIAVCVLVILNTFGQKLMYQFVLNQKKSTLYEEAELIAKEYMSNLKLMEDDVRIYMDSIQTVTDMRMWLVSSAGLIILDTEKSDSLYGENINEYDADFLSNQFAVGRYPTGLVQEKTVSVIYPVTDSLYMTGYIVLSMPISDLEQQAAKCVDAIILCYFVLLGICLLVLVYLYFRTVLPLKKLTAVTKEYANGHYDYPMVKHLPKEQEDLAVAIEYLSGRVRALNEYQKKFIANVSHDFRSPLTSIKGYTEALADGTIPVEMQEKYFQIILFEVERLTKLTGNLLELTQLDSGKLNLELSNFDINEIIKKSVATFEQRCMQKKISIDLIFEGIECSVYADIDKIQQVIQNLVDNAIKFSTNNSVIEISTTTRGKKVFVSVKDHGIGIPKESLSKIWGRFYKTDLSRGKDKTGTGLGLSITKEIIDVHGENINVISTEGVGTEFIFSLPVEKEK